MKFHYLLLLLYIAFITSCSSHKKINKLASELNCNKSIEFVFDKQSNLVKIVKTGPSIGESKIPDYESTFVAAVEELQKSMNTKLNVENTFGFPTDSVVRVVVKIEKIEWNFRAADAIMNTEINFKVQNREFPITGTNTVYWHGTKKGNLHKSLKSGIYQFLSLYCNQ
ncbi:MAG: hypothetical protein ABJJ39_05550 [Kangiellaceae bacterium]